MKKAECTKDFSDPIHGGWLTEFALNLRRLHVRSYCHRIFAMPHAREYDAASSQPQYIGRDEGIHDYRLKGFFLPIDEEGNDYYIHRRLEAAHPGIVATRMWKSSPGPKPSASRVTHRSKMGNCMNDSAPSAPSAPTPSSSSSSKAHAQLELLLAVQACLSGVD